LDSLKEEKEGLEELLTTNQEKIDQLQTKVEELEANIETCSTTR
jgi:predicted nuclease with TOPRIM domain